MKKLKVRLDAFSDAVIAIILTIMVLDLTPVLRDNLHEYLNLGKEIGIYVISFAFVANMWYQHATLFNEIDDMSYRIMLYDFLFLIPLSLTPLATNMMAENTTNITVIAYGLLVGVTGMLFRLLARSVTHFQYTDTSKMRQVYRKIFGQHDLIYVGVNGVLIVLAYFFPEVVLWFYLPYPLVYMLLSSRDRQQMYDVAQLTTEQRQQYLRLPRDRMKQFRQIVETPKPDTATETPSAVQPVKPLGWMQWLDQPIGSGNGTKATATLGNGQVNAEAIRELRRAQWDEFERQTKSRQSDQERAKEERDQQREAAKQAARQAEKQAERDQDAAKQAAKLAAKEKERQQEAAEDAAELADKQRRRQLESDKEAAQVAAENIERQAKAKREAAKQELKIRERQQKAEHKAQRREAKAAIRQKKLAQKAQRYEPKDDGKNQSNDAPKSQSSDDANDHQE